MSVVHALVLGDVCPAWGFPQQFSTGDAENVFHDILPLLANADIVLANLEAPLTDNKEKLKKNSVCLKGQPSDAAVLAKAGLSGVSLANNHILDYGVEGYQDTLKNLDNNGIAHYGTGNKEASQQQTIFQLGDKKIGVLSFAEHEFNCNDDYGVGAFCWDDLISPQVISNSKKECDFLVVQYHGGIEHYIYPSPYLQKKCRVMAEMGADFVVCQHSHCIGTRENWKGSEILYGQGNCIFGCLNGNDQWNQGLIARVSLGEKLTVEYIPIEATPKGERLCSSEMAQQILDKMETESKKILDASFIQKSWDAFCDKEKDMYLPMLFAWGRVANKLNRIFHGRPIASLTTLKERKNVMNLIRCDAHREVVTTILENEK